LDIEERSVLVKRLNVKAVEVLFCFGFLLRRYLFWTAGDNCTFLNQCDL